MSTRFMKRREAEEGPSHMNVEGGGNFPNDEYKRYMTITNANAHSNKFLYWNTIDALGMARDFRDMNVMLG